MLKMMVSACAGAMGVFVLAGCVTQHTPEQMLVPLSEVTTPADQPITTDTEVRADPCSIGHQPQFVDENDARRWVIDNAETQRRAGCVDGSPNHQVCRALWLTVVLDPVELWLDGLPANERERAAFIVDESLSSAVDGLTDTQTSEVLVDLRDATANVVAAIEADDEAIASALIDRNDPTMVDELRALERTCVER